MQVRQLTMSQALLRPAANQDRNNNTSTSKQIAMKICTFYSNKDNTHHSYSVDMGMSSVLCQGTDSN